MDWKRALEEYRNYLVLEKALSSNTVDAYLSDIKKLQNFCISLQKPISCLNISSDTLREMLKELNKKKTSKKSQARILSGIKSFFHYMCLENLIEINPCNKIDQPRIERRLPDILSVEEIDMIINGVDLSTKHGERNKTILESLYSCGLRVSELTELKCSKLFLEEGYLIVFGKGNKERLIPINSMLKKYLKNYLKIIRSHQNISKGHDDYVFLNNRGKKLSRMMIFNIVKKQTKNVLIKKNVSPHTFRHSFASHLLQGGANLRAIQTMLGHESISTTEIYMHIDREFIREEIIQHHPRK